jgi:ADP-ribose pyrophosphatase
MTDFFFFGTLRYLPLLQIVLGRKRSKLDTEPASLKGYAVVQIGKEPFPHLAVVPERRAEGILLRGVSGDEFERLCFYEGGFDFTVREISVQLAGGGTTKAHVFFPDTNRAISDTPWSLDNWVATWADISVSAAREVMAWFGRKTTCEIASAFPGVRRRAAALVSGKKRAADPERDPSQDVIVKAHHHLYAKFFSMQEIDVQFRQYDGSMSGVFNRAAVFVGEAAVVLPYDPVRDSVMLIEQFRAPVFMTGDPAPWVWEPIAGLLEPGESAETAARREAEEEAGLALEHLEPAGEMYSSTGSSTEYLHLFVGLTDLGGDVAGIGGTDEGEDIRSRVVVYDELMQDIDANRHKDMPLVTLALWLSRNRERLRMSS